MRVFELYSRSDIIVVILRESHVPQLGLLLLVLLKYFLSGRFIDIYHYTLLGSHMILRALQVCHSEDEIVNINQNLWHRG